MEIMKIFSRLPCLERPGKAASPDGNGFAESTL